MEALSRITLGATTTRVNRLVLGLGPVGNLYKDLSEAQAQQTLQAWWDHGLRTFDVAPLYGMGMAERRLGEFLHDKARSEFCVATKVGRPVAFAPMDGVTPTETSSAWRNLPPGAYSYFAFSRDAVLRSLDDSLERLGLDFVDLVHIHDPDDHLREAIDETFPALADLRDEGVIRAIGTGVNWSSVAVALINECDLDCVMIAGRYSILEQEALGNLLPRCTAKGIPLLVAGVFNSGFLADPKPGAMYDYMPCWDEDLIDRATRVKSVCERYGVSIKAAALQFPFGHPAVASVVVGAGSSAHVRELVDLFGQSLPGDLWRELLDERLLPMATPVPGGSEPGF
jgi:D-threo-aldose 1-dehydrogenase